MSDYYSTEEVQEFLSDPSALDTISKYAHYLTNQNEYNVDADD